MRLPSLLSAALAAMPLALAIPSSDAEATKMRDLGSFQGIRDVQLMGFGLVTGLQQTGDTIINRATPATVLQELRANGLSLSQRDLMTRNTALVRITASMRSDARIGTRIDVRVSSIGDARSLEGGVLESAMLRMPGDPDLARFFVMAQGPLTVGGFNVEADGNQSRRNVTNVGTVAGGGIVERELPPPFDFATLEQIDFLVDGDHAGWTNTERMCLVINDSFGPETCMQLSPASIRLTLPEELEGQFPRFAAKMEQLEVDPDMRSRVVIDARTGTVVVGGDVTVRPFAISHGGLKIEVGVERGASQPAPFGEGETVIVENTFIGVDEEQGELVLVNAVSLADLVSAMNAMGIKPRDLPVVLQAIKDAGALDAELVLR